MNGVREWIVSVHGPTQVRVVQAIDALAEVGPVVEQVLLSHDGVDEAAAYGLPHPITGETVRVSLVRAHGFQATEADLLAACRRQLVSYKVPAVIEFVSALVGGANGKVLKREMRSEVTSVVVAGEDFASGRIND